ncbi:MAG TPA: glutathione S-transferase family protein [Candidatus Binatia bacterium]
MKLYFNPHSRAVVAKWMLDECGADYELVTIDLQKREHKTPEFLAINPAGKIPALVDGEARLFENGAIVMYLADKFPQAKLAPTLDDPRRGRWLSLMVYAVAQLEPAMVDRMLGVETPPQRGWTDLETAKDVVERELGEGPFLFGDWFTAADLLIGSMFIWKRLWDQTPERPKLEAYVERLLQRPAAPRLGS